MNLQRRTPSFIFVFGNYKKTIWNFKRYNNTKMRRGLEYTYREPQIIIKKKSRMWIARYLAESAGSGNTALSIIPPPSIHVTTTVSVEVS